MERASERLRLLALVSPWVAAAGCACCGGHAPAGSPEARGLREALLFHASFDGKADADFGAGDRTLYQGLGTPLRDTKPGLPESVEIAAGEGKHGDALRFAKKVPQLVFYRAERHVAWSPTAFEGTLSVWMSLDPEKDLEPGYCDPIQLTDKKWDDSCFFVDFDKEGDPRLFRLGVFADFREWNPQNLKWEEFPEDKRPWVVVRHHPFARDKWTHVCFTWEGFNTGREDAIARLYLDGVLQGEVRGKKTYSWDLAQAAVVLGIDYIGLFDDLAVLGRALSPQEVVALGALEGGVRSLFDSKVACEERRPAPAIATRWQSPYMKRTADRARARDSSERPR
jgi:hypothetical protein